MRLAESVYRRPEQDYAAKTSQKAEVQGKVVGPLWSVNQSKDYSDTEILRRSGLQPATIENSLARNERQAHTCFAQKRNPALCGVRYGCSRKLLLATLFRGAI